MRTVIIPTIAAVAVSAITVRALDGDDNPADFFRRDKMFWSQGQRAPETINDIGPRVAAVSRPRRRVAEMVRDEARLKLGRRWSDSAVRLAKIESGYRCHVRGPKTKYGRAIGPLQIMPSSARALGFDPRQLATSCKLQIAAALAHMQACIDSGVTNHRQMASCHVSGVKGWRKRLNRRAQKYRAKYIRTAMAARSPFSPTSWMW